MGNTMLSKIDGIASRLIFSVAKWSLLIFLALLGSADLYYIYSNIFTGGWGLSSLSKFELIFIVASFLLFKRLLKKTSQVGGKIHVTLLNLLVYSGVILVIGMAVISLNMIVAIVEGKNIDELMLELFLFGYEDDLISMIGVLLVLYISAPLAIICEDLAGDEEEAAHLGANKVKDEPVGVPEQGSKFTGQGQDVNDASNGVRNA